MDAVASQTAQLLPPITRPNDGKWTSSGFRSAVTRARWAQLFFALVALGGVMEMTFLSQGMNLVNKALAGGSVSSSEWAAYLKNSTDTDNFYKGAVLCLAITFIAWLSRTVDNVPPLGGGTPHDSPRWAIGWWFVPIAFLWKPYTIVRDAWLRCGTSTRRSGATLVAVWWVGFIGSTILSRYVAVASDSAGIDSINTLYSIGLIGGLLTIVSAICGLLVVREIQGRANERAQALRLGAPSAMWPAGVTASVTVSTARAIPAAGPFCSSCGARRVVAGRYCASCGSDLGVSTPTG